MLSKKCHPNNLKQEEWSVKKAPKEPLIPEIAEQKNPNERLLKPLNVETFPSPSVPFFSKTIDQSLAALKSRMIGLTDGEVESRQKQYGLNSIEEDSFKKKQTLFLNQFKNWAVYLLFLAGIASFTVEEYVGGIVILSALMLNVLLGFITTWKSRQKGLDFNGFSKVAASVKRNNKIIQIPSEDVVPGDILVLSAGQILSADARLIFSTELKMDEALLTGESDLVVKDAKTLLAIGTDVSEQSNMLFAGTRVRTGKAEALVVSTGVDSMVGRIAHSANISEKRETPITQNVNRLGLVVLSGVLLVTLMILALEYYRGATLPHLIPFALILLVSAIPQTLTTVTTFILSLGLKRLAKEGVFIKHLKTFEGIGSISVLCTDKTGTLTENSMTINEVYVPCLEMMSYDKNWAIAEGIPCHSVEILLRIARNCNTTISEGVRGNIMGDPVDIALFRATPAIYSADYRLVRDDPFRPEARKMARILKQKDDQIISMIKGAPEEVICQCTHFMNPTGEILEMDQHTRNELILINREMAIEGAYRVIGLAQKIMTDPNDDPYSQAVYIGWVSLNDPIKPGVEESISACHDIGVDVTMITGDQKATAAIIGKKLGIFKEGSSIWTHRELEHSDVMIPKSVRIFARTKPEDKLNIIESLQNSGEVVAMVGDGVNDTPALHKSDISIAMGVNASEEAKKSSDIILLNDRFEGIIAAVLESRYLITNMKMAIEYLLSCNLGVVILAFISAIVGFGQPLDAIQMLWLNLVIVTFPALTMALVPANPEKICEPLSASSQQIISNKRLFAIAFWSTLIALSGFLVFALSQKVFGHAIELSSTLAFLTVSFVQILNLLSVQFSHAEGRLIHYLKESFKVPTLWGVLALTFILQLITIFIPPMQMLLHTVAFSPELWALPIGVALSAFILSMLLLDSKQLD